MQACQLSVRFMSAPAQVHIRMGAVFLQQKSSPIFSRAAMGKGHLYGYSITDAANGINIVYRLGVNAEPLPYPAHVATNGISGDIV